MATDFSADRDYPGWGVRVVATYTAPPFGSPVGTLGTYRYAATIADETRAAGFLYAAATRTYTTRWFTDTKIFGPATSNIFQGYLPYDGVGTDFIRIPFRIDIASQDYTRYAGGISWTIYTGNGNFIFDSETRDHVSVYGVTTLPSDLPTTGASSVRLNPTSRQDVLQVTYNAGSEDVRLTIDWATGAIAGSWTASPVASAPAGTPNLALTVTGRINLGSSRISGTIAGSGLTGSFTGAAFGPQAREIAFAYLLADGRGGFFSGTTGSKRN